MTWLGHTDFFYLTMEITGKELTAMVKMAFTMAAADGKFVDEEKAIITLGIAEFGLGREEIIGCVKSAERMDPAEALQVLSAMNTNQKKYATGFLAAVMTADGDIADSEVKIWQLICTLTNCPTMSVAEALSFWKNN